MHNYSMLFYFCFKETKSVLHKDTKKHLEGDASVTNSNTSKAGIMSGKGNIPFHHTNFQAAKTTFLHNKRALLESTLSFLFLNLH